MDMLSAGGDAADTGKIGPCTVYLGKYHLPFRSEHETAACVDAAIAKAQPVLDYLSGCPDVLHMEMAAGIYYSYTVVIVLSRRVPPPSAEEVARVYGEKVDVKLVCTASTEVKVVWCLGKDGCATRTLDQVAPMPKPYFSHHGNRYARFPVLTDAAVEWRRAHGPACLSLYCVGEEHGEVITLSL
jgi:hypothetical protein